MGRAQSAATKAKLSKAAQARKRGGGKFTTSTPDAAPPFARFVNRGPVLRDVKIGEHVVRYWPPGVAKSVAPGGEADAEGVEHLERVA